MLHSPNSERAHRRERRLFWSLERIPSVSIHATALKRNDPNCDNESVRECGVRSRLYLPETAVVWNHAFRDHRQHVAVLIHKDTIGVTRLRDGDVASDSKTRVEPLDGIQLLKFLARKGSSGGVVLDQPVLVDGQGK